MQLSDFSAHGTVIQGSNYQVLILLDPRQIVLLQCPSKPYSNHSGPSKHTQIRMIQASVRILSGLYMGIPYKYLSYHHQTSATSKYP